MKTETEFLSSNIRFSGVTIASYVRHGLHEPWKEKEYVIFAPKNSILQ